MLQVVAFDAVYNATAGLISPQDMPRLTPADIAKGDVVVLECIVTRWKKAADGKKRLWTAWDVGLELQSVALLYAAP